MAHAGSVVDIAMRTIRERDGVISTLDRLEVVDGAMHYAHQRDWPWADYLERWVLPEQGWTLSRLRWTAAPEFDWYIEPELIRVEAGRWTIADGLLDVWVFEGSHFRVDDADELADAIEAGEISLADAKTVLRNFQTLERAIREAKFSGLELLRRYAPSLAHFQTPARG